MTMPLKEAFDTMRVLNPDGEVPEFAGKRKSKSFSGDDSEGKSRRRALLDSASSDDDSPKDKPRRLGGPKKDKLQGVKVKSSGAKIKPPKKRLYLVE
jgi:hypothetical protein